MDCRADAFPSAALRTIRGVTLSHRQLLQLLRPAGAHTEPPGNSPSLLFTFAASAFLDLASCPRLLQLGIQSI